MKKPEVGDRVWKEGRQWKSASGMLQMCANGIITQIITEDGDDPDADIEEVWVSFPDGEVDTYQGDNFDIFNDRLETWMIYQR